MSKVYEGVIYPEGDTSFATKVLSYEPFRLSNDRVPPEARFEGGILGAPDFATRDTMTDPYYLTLGNGGRVTLLFEDTPLTGSGNDVSDLYYHRLSETVLTEISQDGSNWLSVGTELDDKFRGGSSGPRGVDIDGVLEREGLAASTEFRYVRLTDILGDEPSGNFAGADLDAVGVIGPNRSAFDTRTDSLPPAVPASSLDKSLASATFDSVTFQYGAAAFADAVIDYQPFFQNDNYIIDEAGYTPSTILGAADENTRASTSDLYSLTLGNGGRATVYFDDVPLVAGGTSEADLYVFLVGGPEDAFVEISRDGSNWLSAGKAVDGSFPSGVDIDAAVSAAGLSTSTVFRYVRLTDDTNQGSLGNYAGADVDAVGVVGPKNAVLGTNSNDVLTTSEGRSVFGLGGNDMINGGASDETFNGGKGNDTINGGAGLDTAVIEAARADITLDNTGNGFTVSRGSEIDTLVDVERVEVNDGVFRLDVGLDENAGTAYRIYQAAFNRTPDNAGLKFWIDAVDRGLSFKDLAAGFNDASEFGALYGGTTNAAYAAALYTNVLGRPGDAAGSKFWTDVLNAGTADRADVLIGFTRSSENLSLTASATEDGIFIA